MASTSSDASVCPHCQREIPSCNIELHSAHCARNLGKCAACGDMVPKKLMLEHHDEYHAPVTCTVCNQTVEREVWALHKEEKCPQRIVACIYCAFELPAVDLFEHQVVCGNRTELCQWCNKYVRLCEWINHQSQFHSSPNGSESSRGEEPIPERGHNAPPRRPRDGSKRQLIITIAITGIAILIGSIFFQRRNENSQQQ